MKPRASSAPSGHRGPDLHLAGEALAFSASPEAYRLEIAPERIVVMLQKEVAERIIFVRTKNQEPISK